MNLERKTQMAAVHTRLQSSPVYTLTRTDCAIGTVPTEPPIPLPPFWSTAFQMLNLQSKVPDKGPLFCPWLMPPRQGGFSVSLSGPQTVWTSWQAVSLAPLNDVADLSRYLQAFQTGGIPSDFILLETLAHVICCQKSLPSPLGQRMEDWGGHCNSF